MKKQVPGYSHPYGYAPRNALGANTGPGGGSKGAGSNLPSIFDNPGPGGLVLPLRHRPDSGLQLDVKALPNRDLFFTTTPRDRAENGGTAAGNRLSSSDTSADRIRQARMLHTSQASRLPTGEGRFLHQRRASHPAVLSGEGVKPIGATPPTLAPIVRRPPSSTLREQPGRKLPPIGAESLESESQEAEGEGESLFGGELAGMKGGGGGDDESDSITDYDSETGSEDEEFLETESEAPPSRPGFESDAESSAATFKVPFPDVGVSAPFPATLYQTQLQEDTERYAANTTTTGLSPRVNNIVRAFEVHGPLDKELLRQALNRVASLHPFLSALFQRHKGQLYALLPRPGSAETTVELETPVVGHEKPEDLILNARRKLFPIHTNNNFLSATITATTSSSGGAGTVEGLSHALSLTSVGDTDFNNADRSPTIPGASHPTSPRKRVVSFARIQSGSDEAGQGAEGRAGNVAGLAKHAQLPSLAPSQAREEERVRSVLLRARLVSSSSSRHILVLSFARIACDFWSSCLFLQQLTDLYSKLEKAASYRPSLAAKKLESKRHEVINAYEKEKRRNGQGRRLDAATRLLQKRAQQMSKNETQDYVPMYSAKLTFSQVGQREKQLLVMAPHDQLLAFWEGVVTATIRRERGTNRTKVVPPLRVPAKLGEVAPVVGNYRRPQTSRLRPLTASRTRPMTARRQGGGVFGDTGFTREALLGPKTKFHFIKIEDEICEQFKLLLPEHCQSSILPEDQFKLFTLGTYILLLAKCCRGWGTERRTWERPIGSSVHRKGQGSAAHYQVFPDPLQKYKTPGRGRGVSIQPIAVGEGHSPKLRGDRRGMRLDSGSFLVGVEVSLRDCEPDMTEGLFGPLTQDTAIRVNLSSCETFADLVLALNRSLQAANKHGHLPFGPVADEVGLTSGLPVKFSYLRHHDIVQLANPNNYFYTETSVGVVNQGLGRLGSNCFLKPLNSKLDDSCHLELVLWESYDLNHSLAGGMRYQPHILKSDLVEPLGEEFRRLLCLVAGNPSARLLDLAKEIHPPFLSSRTKGRGRKGSKVTL